MSTTTTEKDRFTEAFYAVLERDPNSPPSPTQINRELGKHENPDYRSPMNVLNGRMSALRRRLLTENGFVQDPISPHEQGETNFGRWRKAPVSPHHRDGCARLDGLDTCDCGEEPATP